MGNTSPHTHTTSYVVCTVLESMYAVDGKVWDSETKIGDKVYRWLTKDGIRFRVRIESEDITAVACKCGLPDNHITTKYVEAKTHARMVAKERMYTAVTLMIGVYALAKMLRPHHTPQVPRLG
jgi:hypothetical protein